MSSLYDKMEKLNKGRSDIDIQLGLSTPEAFTEWLIQAKGVAEEHRSNIVYNMKEQFDGLIIKGGLTPARVSIDVKLFGWTILTIRSKEA